MSDRGLGGGGGVEAKGRGRIKRSRNEALTQRRIECGNGGLQK